MITEHHHAFRLRQGVLEKLLGSCGVPAGKVKVWRPRWRQLSLQYVGGCVRIRGILWHSEFSELPCFLLFYFAYICWLWNVTRVVLSFFEICTFSFICSSFLFAFPMLNRILIRLLLLTSSSWLSRSDLRSLRDGHAASQCCRYICFHISNICLLFARSGLDCGGIPGGKKCKLWMPRKTPDMRTGEGSILGSACGLDSTSSVFAEVKKGSQLWQFFTERHSWHSCILGTVICNHLRDRWPVQVWKIRAHAADFPQAK